MMKVKLREDGRDYRSPDVAIDVLRRKCEKFYPDWTTVGVTVTRVSKPQGWLARGTLEKEVEW